MEIDVQYTLALAAAWTAYFALHSALASLRLKRLVAAHAPRLMPAYRLTFNVAALVLLILPLVLTFANRGPWLWQWQGIGWWVANGVALLAVAGFLWTLRDYDMNEFWGLRQWRGRVQTVEDQEQLHISPLHRYVRHPWYSLALVILWTRDMDTNLLVTATAITLYFVIGSRLEERKLLACHGEAYREYHARVPGLVPRPWRYLDADSARRLATTGPASQQDGARIP
ncbi:MAG: hypothetical protein JSW10_07740 [Pseudomonadota bacterium]|nr:MAG: hypothetical protein JSW10_07740 [Pseudomonadota bacterium]